MRSERRGRCPRRPRPPLKNGAPPHGRQQPHRLTPPSLVPLLQNGVNFTIMGTVVIGPIW
jgi:hypothetical protein